MASKRKVRGWKEGRVMEADRIGKGNGKDEERVKKKDDGVEEKNHGREWLPPGKQRSVLRPLNSVTSTTTRIRRYLVRLLIHVRPSGRVL